MSDPVEAPFASVIRDALGRLTGKTTGIRVHALPRAGGGAGECEASGGVLTVRATDPVAGMSAFARYARSRLGVRLSWETPRLEVAEWPDGDPIRVETEFGIRYHLNVVTHGYSTAYWDWERWERELDWMALHGVTHPLILTAHEVVLGETLVRSGLDRESAERWIGSAAHIPWMTMGGMHSYGGPLPASWRTRRVELARRILERARALGMTPVLPMVGGSVPQELADADSRHIEWQGWRTPVLEPAGEAYQRFARQFLDVQGDLLGDPGPEPVYAIDPYIESLPPTGEPSELAAAGEGIFRAVDSVHPDAIWLLQGWPFHYHQDFWTGERTEAFLSQIPVDRMLLIDLWGEFAPMWRNGMHGRNWIWTAVHNFGARFGLFGDLRGLLRDLAELRAAGPTRLRGVGLAPEAIENNTVFYELATDLTWDRELDLGEWLDDFADTRYGAPAPEARRAWKLLGETLYGPGRTRSTPSPVIARPWDAGTPFAQQRLAGEALATADRPSANIDAENDSATLGDLPRIRAAAEALLALAGSEVPGLRYDVIAHDVVDLVCHVIAQGSRRPIRAILAASQRRDAQGVRAAAAALAETLRRLDELMQTRDDTGVRAWIEAARSWGETDAEQAVLERDARSLVSVWGHQTSGLHDYSGRHWSGLVRDLYLPRWGAWAEWLADAAERGEDPDVSGLRATIVDIEEEWRDGKRDTPQSDAATTDPLTVAARILRHEAETMDAQQEEKR